MSRQPLVLCADDDEDILALVSLRLRRAGFEVVTAADGDAAIELAREHRPALAVLDVMMPKRTGYEVLEALRGDAAMSGLKTIEERIAFLEESIEDVADRAKRTLAKADKTLGEKMKENPLLVLGAAVGVGYVIGRIFSRLS